ncbi:MAG: exonuclease [Armatimonadetes bacterium]|nr:exonuclease [Armatimonadota bacterium]
MVTITCYDGADCIGGNKILVESGGTAVFLDFGICYSSKEKFYQEFLQPRGVKGLLDPLEMDLLPPLKGIYRDDLVPDDGVWDRVQSRCSIRDVDVQGVLLSHGHLDHSGYISFLKPEIPIACGAMTTFITKAIQDSGRSTMETEVCYAIPKACNGGAVGAARGCDAVQRPFLLLNSAELSDRASDFWETAFTSSRGLQAQMPGTCTCIGSLEVCGYPVDHSIFGATGFTIKTDEGYVVYTGDLRVHGRNGALTRQFAEAAAKLHPLVLITEGTHIHKDTSATEDDVYANAVVAVRAAAGQFVIADFGPRNVERLLSFLRIAEETDRRLVLTAKDVLLLEAMHLVDAAVPEPAADDRIMLYEKAKARMDGWEQHVHSMCGGKSLEPEDIGCEPGRYILCFSFFDLSHLVDINPPPGGIYLYSSSELYSEEQEYDFRRLRNWVSRFGMTLVGDPEDKESEVRYHASGHITGVALAELIDTMQPKHIIPVHTQTPEWFEQTFGSRMTVLKPERCMPLAMSAG